MSRKPLTSLCCVTRQIKANYWRNRVPCAAEIYADESRSSVPGHFSGLCVRPCKMISYVMFNLGSCKCTPVSWRPWLAEEFAGCLKCFGPALPLKTGAGIPSLWVRSAHSRKRSLLKGKPLPDVGPQAKCGID